MTSTAELRPTIHDEPVASRSVGKEDLITKVIQKTVNIPSGFVPSSASAKPVTNDATKRNELFIDLLERLTVLFNSSVRAGSAVHFSANHTFFAHVQGAILRCEVDGTIQVKSFLNGTPEIRMGLNEDIVVGRGTERTPLLLPFLLKHIC